MPQMSQNQEKEYGTGIMPTDTQISRLIAKLDATRHAYEEALLLGYYVSAHDFHAQELVLKYKLKVAMETAGIQKINVQGEKK